MDNQEQQQNEFSIKCLNPECNCSYDSKGFADIYMLWGYILLTDGSQYLIGITCPNCNYTSLYKTPNLPSCNLLDQLETKASVYQPNYGDGMTRYYVPFLSKFRLEELETTRQPTHGTNIDSIFYLPTGFYSPTGITQTFMTFREEDFVNLIKIENTMGLKVFPRIVPCNSVYNMADAHFISSDINVILSNDFMEKAHCLIESLYVSGFNNKNNKMFNQIHYENLILNDLTPDQFEDMDRDYFAWETNVFKEKLPEFLSKYNEIRNRKDFELICYNELINKYARLFYYRKGLRQDREFMAKVESEENQDVPEPEEVDGEFQYYENGQLTGFITLHDLHMNSTTDQYLDNITPNLAPELTSGNYANETSPGTIEKLNKKHAVIMLGGKCLIMNHTFDPTFKRNDLTFSSKFDFLNRYANKKVYLQNKSKKPISEGEYWWDSPNRKEYEGIVFAPGEEHTGHYNLWKGLAVQPVEGDWSLFKNHIFNVIANKNEGIFEWIISWMARIVQDPGGERPGTAIVMKGKMGTGKGIFANNFGALFGKHYKQIAQASQVTGRFNQHLKDALLVFVDEGFCTGDKNSEGVIKNMISEDDLNIEQKGKDVISVKNRMNLIIASNNSWIVPAGLEERRFFVTELSDEWMQNSNYFMAISHQMKNGGREAMLYELQHWNYRNVNLRTSPRTEALFEQICNSMSTVQEFWYERLQSGTILEQHNIWENQVSFPDLYAEYLKFANRLNKRHILSNTQFGKQLRELCKNILSTKTNRNGKRALGKKFPELNECRSEFENIVNMKGIIKWESIDQGANGPDDVKLD